MSEKEKIWNFLKNNKKITPLKISQNENINIDNVKQYINALKKAGYVKHTGTYIKRADSISLIKDTGENYPTFSNGILTDNNTLETIKIYDNKKKSEFKSVLKIYLQAILELNKEELRGSEINKKAKEIWEKNTKQELTYDFSTATRKYRNLLVEKKILLKTGDTIRNSPLFLVNFQEAKKLLETIKDKNIYGKLEI